MRVVGVTPTQDEKTGRITVNQDYLDSLFRAGAAPVLLPLTEDEAVLEEILSRVDGLLLSGGDDVCPALYGEKTLPCCGPIAALRDKAEFTLCRLALRRNMPILAICRGLQVLSCCLGGSLYQDIAAQAGSRVIHSRHDLPADPVHEAAVSPGSRLQAITGLSVLQVNSRHHQAVKALGAGLTVSATAPDGIIEAAEMPHMKFVVGVQWHPESLSAKHPEAQALFCAFTEACGL